MWGLGSDGTSSMTGAPEGVGANFKREIPTLVQIRWISHWLALAGKDFSSSIAYFEDFFDIVDQVTCFYDYSTVRTAGLKVIPQMFDDPVLKLSHSIDTCWLLKGKAFMKLKKIFQAVLISLSRKASEHEGAQAQGLWQNQNSSTYFVLCDTMPEMNKLAKIFQSDNFDYANVNDLLKASYKYFDTLINDHNEAKSIQETVESVGFLKWFCDKKKEKEVVPTSIFMTTVLTLTEGL